MNKQVSLTLPENLFRASKEYYIELGYKNLQEFILALLRQKVLLDSIERYEKIEEEMKMGIGVKRLKQKDAVNHISGL